MPQVTVQINGRGYQIACDEGQEAHLARLGNYIDNRIQELVAAVGQLGDVRLLVMVSLLLADELSDAYAQLKVASADRG
ncbi:MAG: cell division protein ZapA, partial [Rhodospirillales bacterium]|nr:cell division protein ZapA [Rhodospirillales bacterium]